MNSVREVISPMSRLIPKAPGHLRLDIRTHWDGRPCNASKLHGQVMLSQNSEGLQIQMGLPHQPTPRIPDAPPGSRVANLWEYDVVECFLVGRDRYLEVELGAGGHFLVLDFDGPRQGMRPHTTFIPMLDFEPHSEDGKSWTSQITIPWELVPEGLNAVNAFACVEGAYLCHHPLPGPKPDFHQPERFPGVMLG